ERRDALEQIDALEEPVDMCARQQQLSLLCCAKTIFHSVRHPHGSIPVNDTRGSLERMCRPHHCLKMLSRLRLPLQSQQPFGQRPAMARNLQPEQFEQ